MRPILILLMASVVGACSDAAAQQRVEPPSGRYQIVNGTPTYARNIMLLDTQTGRTWVICSARDSTAAWCSMPAEKSAALPGTQ